MESFSNANEISQNGLKEINPTDTPDTSQPLDFSNDGFSVSDFASEKDGNKESEGRIKENSISEQGKLDTSKPIDFSSPEKSNDSTQNSDKTDTIEEQKFSDDKDDKITMLDSEQLEKKGGSYGELKNEGHGWNHNPPEEIHHTPAWEALGTNTEIGYADCPAIAMNYEDHRQTASCGNSREAKEYRATQAELIKEGKIEEAMQMDIDDIHDKFGSKYDEAIAQMQEYAKSKGYI